MLNLNALLELYGFNVPVTKSVKLVRHSPVQRDWMEAFRSGDNKRLEIYQREQGKHHFKDCTHIISFLAEGGTGSLFKGIYRIDRHQLPARPPMEVVAAFPDKVWRDGASWYDMARIDCMAELAERLVVDWGEQSATRSWIQWLRRDKSKQVIEIRPRSSAREFPGFDELRIPLDALQKMVNDGHAYRSWHKALGSVAGVYLIVNTTTGKQYVGMAHGEGGILKRWKDYANTDGHGGNKELMKVEDRSRFQFSILYICSTSKSATEVAHYESLFKEKLGTRVHGLNAN